MVRLPDLTAWAITIFADIFVVYLFLVQWRFRKFLFLNFFFLFSAVIKVILYASFLHFGLASIWYSYFYFISGALLRVLFFLSICELIAHLVKARILRVTLTILRGKPMQWISGAFVAAVLLRVSVPAFWDSYTLIGLLSKFSQKHALCLLLRDCSALGVEVTQRFRRSDCSPLRQRAWGLFFAISIHPWNRSINSARR